MISRLRPRKLGKLGKRTAIALGGLGISLGLGLLGGSIARSQSPPIFENITLNPGFRPDPQSLRGISGGEISARVTADRIETATGPCVGFIDRQPDHVLTLTEFFDYLSMEVEGAGDTTLLVIGPGGTWCNDDLQGKNPAIIGRWLAGNYQVWVGSYERNKFHPYVLRLSETRATR